MTNMTMSDYISEIHFAVESTLPTIWSDYDRLCEVEGRVRDLEAEVKRGYENAEWVAMNALDADDAAHATGMHFEAYFGSDKERHSAQQLLGKENEIFEIRKFSVDSLSGTLLQFAKQGISIIHGNPRNCPPGRGIGSALDLKTVIWQARNQSMHWEEGNLNQSVVSCFDQLAIEYDAKFSNYHNESLAFSIIELLGWKTMADFSRDLMLLS